MSEKWPSAEEVEDWRTKIKNKIWDEFAAEPNEEQGKSLMKRFDALCDAALSGATLLRQMEAAGSPVTDGLCQQYSTPILRQMNRPNSQDAEDMKRIYERDVALVAECAKFEQLAGAIEARKPEEWGEATRKSASEIARLVGKFPGLGGDCFVHEHDYNRLCNQLAQTQIDLKAIEARTVERCANEVPTNWLDPLLTGPKAVIKGLDNRQIEALLRGIQDRIRALPRASDRRNGERRIQDYVYEGLPKRSGTDRRKGEA